MFQAVANTRNGEPVSRPTALKIPPQVPLVPDGGAVGGIAVGSKPVAVKRPCIPEGLSKRGRCDRPPGASAAASGPLTLSRTGGTAADVPPSAATGAAVEPVRTRSGVQNFRRPGFGRGGWSG